MEIKLKIEMMIKYKKKNGDETQKLHGKKRKKNNLK